MFSVKRIACASAVLWGGCILIMGLANYVWPSYGVEFLGIVDSIYPGYTSMTGFGSVIVGTIYAALDGAIGGAIFAWVYNKCSDKSCCSCCSCCPCCQKGDKSCCSCCQK